MPLAFVLAVVDYGGLVEKIGKNGPRPARASKVMVVSKLAIPIGYAIVAILCWIGMNFQVDAMENLRKNGVLTQGAVVDHHVSKGKSTSYYVNYEFEANGARYHDVAKVNRDEYADAVDRQVIDVTYLPDKPAVSRAGIVDALRVARLRSSWQIVIAVITGIVAIAYAILLYNYRRQLNLLASGYCVRATIESIKIHKGKNAHRELKVRFTGADGRAIETKVSAPIKAPWAMTEGSDVPYLYLPESPTSGKVVMQLKLVDLSPAG